MLEKTIEKLSHQTNKNTNSKIERQIKTIKNHKFDLKNQFAHTIADQKQIKYYKLGCNAKCMTHALCKPCNSPYMRVFFFFLQCQHILSLSLMTQ